MILVNGELVEPPVEDLETGNSPSSSFCGCDCSAQEEKNETFAFAVVNQQEVEAVPITEDIIEEMIRDIVE